MASGLTIQVNTRQFEQAIMECLEHTSRTVPEVINKACVDIIIKAAAETPKATKAKIVSELTREVASTSVKGSKTVTRQAQLIYLILNAKQKKVGGRALNNQQMKVASKAYIARRIASVGYIAFAGWNPALKAFGGRGFERGVEKPKGVTTSNADSGFGIAASVAQAVAVMVNCATGAGKIGAEPFQRVMNSKALDMINYLVEKLKTKAESQRGR